MNNQETTTMKQDLLVAGVWATNPSFVEAFTIAAMLEEGNREYVDNHDDTVGTVMAYVIMAKTPNAAKDGTPVFSLCPIWKGETSSLNPLYISEDGKLRLSYLSVGGAYTPGHEYKGQGQLIGGKSFY